MKESWSSQIFIVPLGYVGFEKIKWMENKTVKEKKGVGKITLYTLPHCMHCKVLKSTLDKMDIPYTDVDVEEKEKMGDWLEDNLKTESYPIIYFERVPGEYVYILSNTNLESLSNVRIFTTIEQALEILLKYYYEI